MLDTISNMLSDFSGVFLNLTQTDRKSYKNYIRDQDSFLHKLSINNAVLQTKSTFRGCSDFPMFFWILRDKVILFWIQGNIIVNQIKHNNYTFSFAQTLIK